MKAAIYHGPGDIRVEEIERPRVGDTGLVIRVGACGICPIMDIPRYRRKLLDCATGIAFGHEFSGEVVEVGPETAIVEVGDKVHGLPYLPCNRCDACRAGDYGRCRNFTEGTAGTWINGAFAEYLCFPFASEENVIKLPRDMSHRDGSLIEPLGVGIGLAGKAQPGDVAVILGQELIGLATLAHMKATGVAKVIVSDISEKRLEKSRQLGADVVINDLTGDTIAAIMAETSGRGADVVIETAGRAATFQQAIDAVRPHGDVWLGTFYEEPFLFDPGIQRPGMPHSNLTQKGGISLHCAWLTLADRKQRRRQAVALIQSGTITADEFVTGVFPLENIREAFQAAMNTRESIKVIIEP